MMRCGWALTRSSEARKLRSLAVRANPRSLRTVVGGGSMAARTTGAPVARPSRNGSARSRTPRPSSRGSAVSSWKCATRAAQPSPKAGSVLRTACARSRSSTALRRWEG
eukprot:14112346-Alexandrium_andersonii.AAC.1